MAMGQTPVPPVNIPIPTKIGSKMGGAPKTPKWYHSFEPQPWCLWGLWTKKSAELLLRSSLPVHGLLSVQLGPFRPERKYGILGGRPNF